MGVKFSLQCSISSRDLQFNVVQNGFHEVQLVSAIPGWFAIGLQMENIVIKQEFIYWILLVRGGNGKIRGIFLRRMRKREEQWMNGLIEIMKYRDSANIKKNGCQSARDS